MRQGIRRLLETEPDIQIIAEAGDGLEAFQETKRLCPDILLVDISMPGLNGIEVARRVHRECLDTRVIIISMHAEDEYVRGALEAGVIGYVVKESGIDHLLRAIRQTDGCYLSPPLRQDPASYP